MHCYKWILHYKSVIMESVLAKSCQLQKEFCRILNNKWNWRNFREFSEWN